MQKIGMTEFQRRFSSGYCFVVSSDEQEDNKIFSEINTLSHTYTSFVMSLYPDAVCLIDDRGNRMAISVIERIMVDEIDNTSYIVAIDYSIAGVSHTIILDAFVIK